MEVQLVFSHSTTPARGDLPASRAHRLGVLASTGVALADCPAQSVSTPFSQWGDTNNYFLVPGGNFEGTSDQVGWTLSGASLTPGNEPFYVDGSGDSQSLTISAGGPRRRPTSA